MDMSLLGTLIFFSYPVGGPFAFAVGLIQGFVDIRLRNHSILMPVFAAITVSLVGVPIMAVLVSGGSVDFETRLTNGVMLILPCALVASLVCWLLTRRLARAP
jgi:uncharacterized membrane protein YjjP (DUF1212 family)